MSNENIEIDLQDTLNPYIGPKGDDGTTYVPSVSEQGVISWTNDGGKTNPNPVNIKGNKGADAKINGVNTLSMIAGKNITIEQTGETLKINSKGGSGMVAFQIEGENLYVLADEEETADKYSIENGNLYVDVEGE